MLAPSFAFRLRREAKQWNAQVGASPGDRPSRAALTLKCLDSCRSDDDHDASDDQTRSCLVQRARLEANQVRARDRYALIERLHGGSAVRHDLRHFDDDARRLVTRSVPVTRRSSTRPSSGASRSEATGDRCARTCVPGSAVDGSISA